MTDVEHAPNIFTSHLGGYNIAGYSKVYGGKQSFYLAHLTPGATSVGPYEFIVYNEDEFYVKDVTFEVIITYTTLDVTDLNGYELITLTNVAVQNEVEVLTVNEDKTCVALPITKSPFLFPVTTQSPTWIPIETTNKP